MSSRPKSFGVGLIAVLALMALVPAASTAAEFHTETAHTVIAGEQPEGTNDVFTFNAGTVTCKSITYAGTSSSATSGEFSVTPTYKECTAFGFVSTPIDVNGCELRETAVLTTPLHIVCGLFGGPMVITGFNCWVTIGSQTVTSGVTFTNAGSGSSRDVTVDVNLGALSYTQHSKSFPGCTNGVFGNGKLVGKATVKRKTSEGGAVGFWYE